MKQFWISLASVVTRMRKLPDDVKPFRVTYNIIDALNAFALGEDKQAQEHLALAEFAILHSFEEAGYKWWTAYHGTAGLVLKDFTHPVNNTSGDYVGRFFGKFEEVWQYALDEIAKGKEREEIVKKYVKHIKSFPRE